MRKIFILTLMALVALSGVVQACAGGGGMDYMKEDMKADAGEYSAKELDIENMVTLDVKKSGEGMVFILNEEQMDVLKEDGNYSAVMEMYKEDVRDDVLLYPGKYWVVLDNKDGDTSKSANVHLYVPGYKCGDDAIDPLPGFEALTLIPAIVVVVALLVRRRN